MAAHLSIRKALDVYMPICLDEPKPQIQFRQILPSAVATCVVAALCCPIPLHGLVGDRPSKFFVHFVATSTVVRSDWSGNQDVYLVELKAKSGGTPFLAKLVDEYPGYGSAIPRRLLLSDGASLLKVKRDPECDVRYAVMPKRAAPGDPKAIIPAPMTFVPNTYPQVDPDFEVKCFRLVHQ